ncbi:MAG: ABC transporter ATP-binding protein [Acidimicrobiales bacterium]
MDDRENSTESAQVLDVDELTVYFESGRGRAPIRAVDGVSLTLAPGETIGLIGESGSGKTTIGRAIAGLVPARSGRIRVNGIEIWKQRRREQRRLRSSVQVIFQDPSEALDPRMTVAASIREPLRVRDGRRRPEHDELVSALLAQVGLDPAHGDRRPHEMSGGQKQRVNIARALVLDPQLIVCDEVVSALDVSIQAEILNLFASLKRDREIAYVFISHDLSVVAHVADRVAVMYLGVLMEVGPVDQVVTSPRHPYTQALVDAQPLAVPSYRRPPKAPPIEGDIPSPAAPPSGCRFRTRCPHADQRCAEEVPELRQAAPGHVVACHYAEQLVRVPGGTPDPRASTLTKLTEGEPI